MRPLRQLQRRPEGRLLRPEGEGLQRRTTLRRLVASWRNASLLNFTARHAEVLRASLHTVLGEQDQLRQVLQRHQLNLVRKVPDQGRPQVLLQRLQAGHV